MTINNPVLVHLNLITSSDTGNVLEGIILNFIPLLPKRSWDHLLKFRLPFTCLNLNTDFFHYKAQIEQGADDGGELSLAKHQSQIRSFPIIDSEFLPIHVNMPNFE